MSQDENQTLGIDVEEFLEFYLLDSQEQIDKLGAGLLQLEKEGSNVALINDLFRSAHSLKGASGTMGFTPIVALTHAAEDLLDRLRQGKMEVSLGMIDILLSVTDRVKAMLGQVEQRMAITEPYEDLVTSIRGLMSGDQTPASEGASKETGAAEPTSELTEESVQAEDNFVPKDFALSDREWGQISDARDMSREIYQVDVILAPNTLMKAVRAVMVTQRLENMGTVIKMSPSIEEIETGNVEAFSVLVISDELGPEIRNELLEISEIGDVLVHIFTSTQTHRSAQSEVAAASATAVSVPPVAYKKESDLPKVAQPSSAPAAVSPAGGGQPAANGTGNEGNNTANHYIRVDTARMDSLINMVGEMVITRTRLVQITQDLKNQYRNDSMINNLNETNVYLGRLMNDLQESVMRLRMVPIGTVFSRFPRLVRDLSRKTGKEVELVLKGEDTELDKTVVEVIGDPLMHLIRNSVDHGIESPEERIAVGKPEVGVVTLDAYHEGNHIAIVIADDGRGLPVEKIREKAIRKGIIGEKEELSDREIANLIFLPGFSTAEKVTDISGRGVGMDVVKKALNNLGGIVDTNTRKGQGTTFTIRLPLTLAIIQALLVEVGEEIYAVPLSSVLETLLVNRKDIKTVGGLPMVQLRGNTLPLISLQEKFSLPAPAEVSEDVFVVVVGLGGKVFGLVVDELRGQQEIVIKSLGDLLSNLPGIAGATILGDGKVTLILDIGSMIQDILVDHNS